MAKLRFILHGKAAGNADVRAAVASLRQLGHVVDARVTWESGDAERLAAEAVAQASGGAIDCIVAGGGDGTVNEVFAAAYFAVLPAGCSLGLVVQSLSPDPSISPTSVLEPNSAHRWPSQGRCAWSCLDPSQSEARLSMSAKGQKLPKCDVGFLVRFPDSRHSPA